MERVTYNRNSRKSMSILSTDIKHRKNKMQQRARIPESSKKLINEIIDKSKSTLENQMLKSIYQILKLNHHHIDVVIKESETAKLRKERIK